ncbi:MAG: hypothetical protein R2701_11770 [Acidimicrobiales bacterium]
MNIAYPDTAATYWTMSYALAPDEHLELAGQFPGARYALVHHLRPDRRSDRQPHRR